MKCKIRIDENNPQHTSMTVFMDGANCGKLCMKSVEAFAFFHALTSTQAINFNTEIENKNLIGVRNE